MCIRDRGEDVQQRLDVAWRTKCEVEIHRDDLQQRLDRLWMEKQNLEALLTGAPPPPVTQAPMPPPPAPVLIHAAGAAQLDAAAFAALVADHARLRTIEASTSWRVMQRFRCFLDQRPTLKSALRAPLAAGWRMARSVKQAVRRP